MRYKYPRTYHLPWSEGATNDDKVLANVDHFIGKRVVVTEKMDGENTTLYSDGMHARSVDSKNHPSRDWLKAFHASFAYDLPPHIRICGENMYAQHSIYYEDLESYFYGFSAWDKEYCFKWSATCKLFEAFGITTVPVLYEGLFDEQIIKKLTGYKEGYVVRLEEGFHIENFEHSVAKFVRANHVQTDEHWMHSSVKPNKLRR